MKLRKIFALLAFLTGFVFLSGPIPAQASNCYVVSAGALTDGSACSGVVTVDNSVTSIADYAFANNHNITGIILPNGIVSIGHSTFEGSYLTSIILPSTVTTLGNGAFAGTPHLSSIQLDTGLTTIPDVAFEGSAISSLNIPSGVVSIGNNAFESSGISTVWLPNSLTSLGNYEFRYDNSLHTVNYCGSNAAIQNYSYGNSVSPNCGLFPPTFTLSSTSETATMGSSVTGYTITSLGGAITSFNISAALPAGLSFDTTTGLISGIPTAVTPATSYTIGAHNAQGDAYATYSIAVVTLTAPIFSLSSTSETSVPGRAIVGYSINSSGGRISNYSISPDISSTPGNGLIFSTTTGLISGTPTAVAPALTYTITAHNLVGTTSATYTITVLAQPAISISTGKIAISLSQETFTVGTSAYGEGLLDAPIICGGGVNPCNAELDFTSNKPALLTISPQSLVWTAGGWSAPQFFNIYTNANALNGLSETVTVTTSVSSQSAYYSGYSIPNMIFTLNAVPVAVAATPVPDPVQQSKIISLTPTTVDAGTSTPIVLSGSFIENIRNIEIGSTFLPAGSWVQTLSSLAFTLPGKSVGTYQIQIFNGSAPVLTPQNVTFSSAPISAVAPSVALIKQKALYIRCVNGSHIRISYGVTPTCPVGYVRK